MTAPTLDRKGLPIRTHSAGGYSRGCRCGVCRAARAAQRRLQRGVARRRSARFTDHVGRYLAPNITHGAAAGYVEAGCRCRPCTDAESAGGGRRA